MIKANIEILEEISQMLSSLASRQDEILNLTKIIRAEMEDDAEFLLYPQGETVCERLDDAISSMNTSLYTMQSLYNVMERLPDRYKDIEKQSVNAISEIITKFEEIKTGADAILGISEITIPDCYNDSESTAQLNAVMNYENRALSVADVALITSIAEEEYKVEKVEDLGNSD